MAAAADGGLGCVAGAGREAAGRRARRASPARPSAASGALAVVCWLGCCECEKLGLSMFAALCAVHGDGGAAVCEWGGVGVGVRVQERVLGGLVRARCVVVQRVRLAGDRVVERGCRRGAMGQRGVLFFHTRILISDYSLL